MELPSDLVNCIGLMPPDDKARNSKQLPGIFLGICIILLFCANAATKLHLR